MFKEMTNEEMIKIDGGNTIYRIIIGIVIN
jgi:bacteriocin-like protein